MSAPHAVGLALLVAAATAPAWAQTTRYVSPASPAPGGGFTSWATAATSIQDAIDAAVAGDTVLVTNGIYDTGGRAIAAGGAITNRIAITNAITVISVNGPEVTIIKGLGPIGDGAVRCAYMTNGATLSGFTLTNGYTRQNLTTSKPENFGGGVFGAVNTVLSNCMIVGNAAYQKGGGAYEGRLFGCTLVGNEAGDSGGGIYNGVLIDCLLASNRAVDGSGGGGCLERANVTWSNCTFIGNRATGVNSDGGGLYAGSGTNVSLHHCSFSGNQAGDTGGGVAATGGGLLNHCTFSGNMATNHGGGVYGARLNNGVLVGNTAGQYGGGANASTLNNCVLAENTAGTGGGGAYNSTLTHCTVSGNAVSPQSVGGGVGGFSYLTNCIVYYNLPGNYDFYPSFAYSCTTPLPGAGEGNIDAEPALVNTSHISSNSPCRGAGTPVSVLAGDLDGDPWQYPPSMGCDEPVSYTGALSAAIVALAPWADVPVGYTVDFKGVITGQPSSNVWDFADGYGATNRVYTSHAFDAPGTYLVKLMVYNDDYPAGITGTVAVVVVPPALRYVWKENPAPSAPYTSWETAATNIQDAIDAARWGDAVLVTNGVYDAGGQALNPNNYSGLVITRVVINKAITVRSVNGPGGTTIRGSGPIDDPAAARCVYVGAGAVLSGFTLTNGCAYGQDGGGVWCDTLGVVSNCVVAGNAAGGWGADGETPTTGGGAYGGTLKNCTLFGNTAGRGGGVGGAMLHNCALYDNVADAQAVGGPGYGGAAYQSWLNNCTLVRNTALGEWGVGGGACYSRMTNCIVYYNSGTSGANYEDYCFVEYSCTVPLPASGSGNITNDPVLLSFVHIATNSPCVGAGMGSTTGVDLDGDAWRTPPAMGCDEPTGPFAGSLAVSVTASATNGIVGWSVALVGQIAGAPTTIVWAFGDGSVPETNRLITVHTFAAPGTYEVSLTAFNDDYPAGVAGSVQITVAPPAMHYVWPGNPGTPVAPYTNWATAATNIQDAIDAANAGEVVLVTNGVYAAGGRVVAAAGATTNRIALTNAITVLSVNGREATVICGASGTRGVYVGAGALLSGFTITNGSARAGENGGGVWCETAGVVSNCLIAGCQTDGIGAFGGGVYQGTLHDCTLAGNVAEGVPDLGYGGGAANVTLHRCTVSGNVAREGGGVHQGTLYHCRVFGNQTVSGAGGGLYGGSAQSCAIYENISDTVGGGASGNMTLNNCTISGNSAKSWGGGVYQATLYNCIVYYNAAALGANYYADVVLSNSCTTPLPPMGSGNITNEPLLCSRSQIASNSPCVGRGQAAYASGTDLDGEAWGVPPSMGCDEPLAPRTGALSVTVEASVTNLLAGWPVVFIARIEGKPARTVWDFGDGSGAETNRPSVAHTFAGVGSYAVSLVAFNDDYPGGVTGMVQVVVDVPSVRYVRADNPSPAAPFKTWETAATNIQDAIDAALGGETVLVTNGTYTAGGKVVISAGWRLLNRVAINKGITVASVNGPAATVIQGAWHPGTTNGDRAVRGAYVGAGAVLSGFTLSNGATRLLSDMSGGGVYCETNAVLSNCVIAGNAAYFDGGGVYQGVLYDCVLAGNLSCRYGGGVYQGVLYRCTLAGNRAVYGGGTYCFGLGALSNCLFSGNIAELSGGGAFRGVWSDCTFSGNIAGNNGGGVCQGVLLGCTLAENRAGANGGGVDASVLTNCVLSGNTANSGGGASGGSALTTCTLSGNTGLEQGGGAYGSALMYCTLSANVASNTGGGGAASSGLTNCVLSSNRVVLSAGAAKGHGGGVYQSNVKNCVLIGNFATNMGGGAYQSTLKNCALYGNFANGGGGGVSLCKNPYGALLNCTLVGNSANYYGGGAADTALTNCIVYSNSCVDGANYQASSCTLAYSCASPLPTGPGNLDVVPKFVDVAANNYRLLPSSPCLDQGTNQAWMVSDTDLEGNKRKRYGGKAGSYLNPNVDMGAYEGALLGTTVILR